MKTSRTMQACLERRVAQLLTALSLSLVLLNVHAAPAPSIALSAPMAASQTEDDTITLQGMAASPKKLINVVWVNQFGERGAGTLSAQGWTVPSVPLRPGVNLLSVTVVDAGNQSATVHLAVNRVAAPGAVPVPALKVGSGFYKNRPIQFQLLRGLPVVEGDVLLTAVSATPARPTRVATSPPKASAMSDAVTPDGIGISYTSQIWPVVGGVHQIPYVVTSLNSGVCSGSGSNSNLSSALSTFNSQFSGLIQFVTRGSQAQYVNICVDGSGSSEGYAYVGMVSPAITGGQTLQCGSGCTVATWLHEMGHTVGLLHEHQRPDRASYLTLNLTNADLPNVPGNFTLFADDFQTFGLYDYASVMHYGAFGFSKAGLPVLESIPAGIPLSNTSGYSTGDVDGIDRLYGAAPSQVTITTNPTGLQIVVDGTTYTAPHAFSFALNSSHTLSLPADPQNVSPADGSTYAFGNWNDLGSRSHTITVAGGSGTLAAPASAPAITTYEASFIRLQPFAFMSPAVFPSGAGTVATSPSPVSEYGGVYFTDRTRVQLTLTGNAGYNFYDWFNLPYPPSDNPHTFYIQAPITQAQAVYVTTPVTIVGESLTGPNTWNPGIAGSVDGNFAFLPSAFSPTYNGTSAWAAGTTHTVAVGQTQSPVTTNVYYNWNSWSDGKALSHSITQPASGSQTITASLTPFYASYTVPPPLGSSNPNCAGGVATSPAGSAYSLNTSFGFYGDGTSVTATATANSAYPGMVFAGWSGGTGSLSGTTNPQSTTIHDQFVPTANFNVISTPLAITSLSPSSAVSSASATLDVTINGTGFTSNDTYTYFNNSYRANTFVSSTQIVMHLTAGDLSTAGGQDIFVGNYITNSSNATCGVGAETSLTVGASAAASDGASAKFSGKDSVTQGTWTNVYGGDGVIIANGVNNAPSYAAVTFTGAAAYTWTASTTDPRALQTASGSSTRIASAEYASTSFTANVNITDGNTHRMTLYLLDWDYGSRSETVSILDAATNAVLDTETFSSFQNGQYASWSVSGHILVKITSTGGPNAVLSGLFFDPTAAAKYTGVDTTTQGTWPGSYGEDGYQIANGATSTPSYATVGMSGAAAYTWVASTTDSRALQTAPSSSNRIASAYYAAGTFTFNVNLTDGKTHRVGLYLLDWDNSGRSETITILDAVTNAVLDSENYNSFLGGEYATWNLTGHVLIQVKATGGPNAVVSGLFFGTPPAAAATYVGFDTATQGTWTGRYGADGDLIANDAYSPASYASVSMSGDNAYTWSSSTTDVRALQTASGSTTRIASTYYGSTFTLNVTLADAAVHKISLYLLDWDNGARAESISILDAGSNAVLDTRTYSGFQNGGYAAWNIQGHVIIKVTSTGGPNAVFSGLFFN